MKTLKRLQIVGLFLVLTMTTMANDYALLDSYPLLKDMKMAEKEQLRLDKIQRLILDRNRNNKNILSKEKHLFKVSIRGLSEGDKNLGLEGTTLVSLKNKIKTIELLWSQEESILDAALNNKMYAKNASLTIDKLIYQMTLLNKLYQQSYDKYRQNSVIKSLVSSYMLRENTLTLEPKYALNL